MRVNKQSILINKQSILIKTTTPGRGSAPGAPLQAALFPNRALKNRIAAHEQEGEI